MPHSTGDPRGVIRIVRRWEESPVRLLTGHSLLFGRRDDAVPGGLGLLRLVVVVVVVAALLGFGFSPVVRLSLLAVVDEEGERGGQADDDEAFQDAVVQFVVVVVGAVAVGHAVGHGLVVVVVCTVVVRVRIFEEVGDPFAEGPFFLGLWRVSGFEIELLASTFWLTWFRLDRLDLAVCDCVPETTHA